VQWTQWLFFHFGLEPERIIATFGERSSSGSNHGGYYYDGNIAYQELSHNETPYDPDIFPADPNEDERALLELIPGDLSSKCSTSNFYCDQFDLTYLNENGWPDLIIVGSFYSSLISDEVKGNATARNVPIIQLTNTYSEDEDVENARDMIAMIERMEELSYALGVDETKSMVSTDKITLCQVANSFQESAQKAHEKGIRSMAAYMPYQSNPVGVTGAFIPNPDRDPVLSLMQNLGLPIIYNEHSGSYWENRAGNYLPGNGNFVANNTVSLSGIPYHVDFWLYDDRVSLDFLSEKFAMDWPHPATVSKQYAYWPSNARILSYRHATEILSIVGKQLDSAKRVTPQSTCVEPKNSSMRKLAPGEYSCLTIVPINFCHDIMKESSPQTSIHENSSGSLLIQMSFLTTMLSLSFATLGI